MMRGCAGNVPKSHRTQLGAQRATSHWTVRGVLVRLLTPTSHDRPPVPRHPRERRRADSVRKTIHFFLHMSEPIPAVSRENDGATYVRDFPVMTGGLMRCCLATLDNHANEP